MSDDSAVCAYCKNEIQPGEPRWTGLEPAEYWHYKCADAAGVTKPNQAAYRLSTQSKRD